LFPEISENIQKTEETLSKAKIECDGIHEILQDETPTVTEEVFCPKPETILTTKDGSIANGKNEKQENPCDYLDNNIKTRSSPVGLNRGGESNFTILEKINEALYESKKSGNREYISRLEELQSSFIGSLSPLLDFQKDIRRKIGDLQYMLGEAEETHFHLCHAYLDAIQNLQFESRRASDEFRNPTNDREMVN